jgi:hypothetical protein
MAGANFTIRYTDIELRLWELTVALALKSGVKTEQGLKTFIIRTLSPYNINLTWLTNCDISDWLDYENPLTRKEN